MGKILSLMGRPLRNFNIESRAHKLISQEKPIPAPRHKTELKYEEVMKNHPDGFEAEQGKHEQLDKYLKEVYVKSHDPLPLDKKPQSNPDRPLPLNRSQVEDFEYGFKEPERVPIGKTTLKKALQFITDHHNDSKLYAPKKIAQDYEIPEDTIRNILKYYKVYEIYIPEQRKVKAKFAGPSIPRIKIKPEPRKQLTTGKENKDET